jgi:hypothetical protein
MSLGYFFTSWLGGLRGKPYFVIMRIIVLFSDYRRVPFHCRVQTIGYKSYAGVLLDNHYHLLPCCSNDRQGKAAEADKKSV